MNPLPALQALTVRAARNAPRVEPARCPVAETPAFRTLVFRASLVQEEDAYALSTLKASRPAAVPIRRPTTARGIPHYAAENLPAPGKILDLKIRARQDGAPRARPRNAATLRIHPFPHALLRASLRARFHAFRIHAQAVRAQQNPA